MSLRARARSASYGAWSEANPLWAALLFLWIAADSLTLILIAKWEGGPAGPTSGHAPRARAVLGALASACLIVLIGASPPVRSAIFAFPALLIAMLATIALFVLWASYRLARLIAKGHSPLSALEAAYPSPFTSFLVTELRMMHLALFRWRAAPDVPDGARPFSYHRYLVPMCVTLLILQGLELAVVHLLLALWDPDIALAVLALSLGGLLWLIALIKGLRLRPILLEDDALRVRFSALVDFAVPYSAIARLGEPLSEAQRRAASCYDLCFLSAPNVTLTLNQPLSIMRGWRGSREITHIALRLDDSAAFTAALTAKLSAYGNAQSEESVRIGKGAAQP